MNFVGLTGDPVTQMEVAGQLHVHAVKYRASLAILCSVRTHVEIRTIAESSGEIWHVGPSPLALHGCVIHRTLDAATPQELANQVLRAFISFTTKTPETGASYG